MNLIFIFIAASGIGLALFMFYKFREEACNVYSQIAVRRGGQVANMPLNPIFPSLKINIGDDTAYFIITFKGLEFVVLADKLKDHPVLWITDIKSKKLGSWKAGSPEFEQEFSVYRGPKQAEVFDSQCNADCQRGLLALRKQVQVKANNIWVELIHIPPRNDIFNIKISNFLISRKGVEVTLESPEFYELILDRCIETYQHFRQSRE
jgi:hypothetical protein